MKINDDTIARYLRNELSPDELSKFTVKMVMDKNLKQEVAAMRMVFNTLKTTPATLPIKTGTSNQLLLWGATLVFLLGIAGLGYWYFVKTIPPVPPSNKIVRPIAANFTPIDYFEQFVVAENRDLGIIETLIVPQNDLTTKTGQVIRFQGTTRGTPASIKLTIWNNKEADFEAEKPVFQTAIPVEANRFDFVFSQDLPEGLYYFTLEEEAYFGKFVVRN